MQEGASRAGPLIEQESGAFFGRGEKCAVIEDLRGAGERVDHQSVPAPENLVVLARLHSLIPHGEQLRPRLRQLPFKLIQIPASQRRALLDRLWQIENALLVLEVAVVGYIINDAETLALIWSEHLFDFRRRPYVKLAFLPFAVGIFGAVKATGRIGHIAQDVIAGLADRLREAHVLCDLQSIKCRPRNP